MRPGFLAVVVPLFLAGCVGGGDAAGVSPTSSEIVLDETQGAIRGAVLDEEFRPIPNATVAIASLNMLTQSDPTGRFQLGPLPAGGYDVSAYALGYGAMGRRIEVVAGSAVEVTFALPILSATSAFYEVFPYVGFEQCQWYFEGAIAHCTLPYTQVVGTLNETGVNPGLPKDLQDNRDRYNFTVRAEHTGIVSELIWQPASAAAAYQALILACGWYDPLWDECVPPGETHTGLRYHFEVGTSPVQLVWKMDEEQLGYLAKSPWVMSRANVYGSDQIAAGFALEQRIEMYNSVFYGTDPPEGYTAGPSDQ